MAEVNVSARLTPYSGRILVEGDLLRSGDLLIRADVQTPTHADQWVVLDAAHDDAETNARIQTVPGGGLWRRFKEWLLGPYQRPLPEKNDRLVVLANAHHEGRGTATPVGEVMDP
jgi:hypothetical protein